MSQKKYFGTDGIRGRVGENLINPEFVLKLGWAVGRTLKRKSGDKILIGKDTRISGYMFESALEAGLSAAGINVYLLGPMPTPAIAYLTQALRANAGIVISASHNPYYDNGIKIFSNQGKKLTDEMELAIESEIANPMQVVDSAHLGKAFRANDAPGRYIEFCKSTVPFGMSLNGFKIIIDCAYGATYHVAPDVFKELGAKVIEIGTEPDGTNINDNAGATHPQILQKIVVAENADLGIAFDGDGDRVMMVDHQGEIVDGDELLYIIFKQALDNNRWSGGLVGTVMTNLGLEEALAALNVPFQRTPVGDRYVLQALEKNNWFLGGENSGHIVNLKLTTTGDGIISALQILKAMADTGKTLAELKSGMNKCPQILINVPIATPINLDQNLIIQKAIRDAEQKLNGTGRILLRVSGTEPVVRVMVEGQDFHQVQLLAKNLADVVKQI